MDSFFNGDLSTACVMLSINVEFLRTWNEFLVDYFRGVFQHLLEEMSKTTINISQYGRLQDEN
jgi:hypothetical protein